jgi:site-specific recombinase XerD
VQNVKNIHALFISQIGTSLSARTIAYRVEYWLNRAGICSGVSAKNLRSTFAVRLYSVRPNLRLLQEALDYKDIRTAVVYAVIMDGELESAMEEI